MVLQQLISEEHRIVKAALKLYEVDPDIKELCGTLRGRENREAAAWVAHIAAADRCVGRGRRGRG